MDDLLLRLGSNAHYIGQRDRYFLSLVHEPCNSILPDLLCPLPYAEGWSLLLADNHGERALALNNWDDMVWVLRRGKREADMTFALRKILEQNGSWNVVGRGWIFVTVPKEKGVLIKMMKWKSPWTLKETGRGMIFDVSVRKSAWYTCDLECVAAFLPEMDSTPFVTLAFFDKFDQGRTRFSKDVQLKNPVKIKKMMSVLTITYAGVLLYTKKEGKQELTMIWTAKSKGGNKIHCLAEEIDLDTDNFSWCAVGYLDEIIVYDKDGMKYVAVNLRKNKVSKPVHLSISPGSLHMTTTNFRDMEVLIAASNKGDDTEVAAFSRDGNKIGRSTKIKNVVPIIFTKCAYLVVKDVHDHHAAIDCQNLLQTGFMG